jgi:hypothetical protein
MPFQEQSWYQRYSSLNQDRFSVNVPIVYIERYIQLVKEVFDANDDYWKTLELLSTKANVSEQGHYGYQHLSSLLAGRRQYRNEDNKSKSLDKLKDEQVCAFADVAADFIHLRISRE